MIKCIIGLNVHAMIINYEIQQLLDFLNCERKNLREYVWVWHSPNANIKSLFFGRMHAVASPLTSQCAQKCTGHESYIHMHFHLQILFA